MSQLLDIENQAGLTRVTAGWKKPHLPLEVVRRYWRDVHSPAIARRAGLYEYRHSQFDPVRDDVFAPVPGVRFTAPAEEQLMWLSDVRYLDDTDLAAFGVSPADDAKANLLGDIDLIVDRSSTYKVVGAATQTYRDDTGNGTPQGPALPHSFGVFFRQRSSDVDAEDSRALETALHASVDALARRWAKTPGVSRVRVNLFEAPDMEAEKKAGYPIKTHPKEQQYQAWIDLVVTDANVTRALLVNQAGQDTIDYAAIGEIHAYPVVSLYTFVYAGKPTLVGLRGYAAYDAITTFDASNHQHPSLLRWMYGDVIDGSPRAVDAAQRTGHGVSA